MIEVAGSSHLLECEWPYKHYEHIADGILAFERAELLFVFNFNPTHSFEARKIGCKGGDYRVVLSTDDAAFGGFGRVDTSLTYSTSAETSELSLYLPARSAVVLARNVRQ
jgi:1,4-alpha-glucan branching enzyme